MSDSAEKQNPGEASASTGSKSTSGAAYLALDAEVQGGLVSPTRNVPLALTAEVPAGQNPANETAGRNDRSRSPSRSKSPAQTLNAEASERRGSHTPPRGSRSANSEQEKVLETLEDKITRERWSSVWPF